MSEIFDGTVEVQDGGSLTTILLDGNAGLVTAGGNGQNGLVAVQGAAGSTVIQLNGASSLIRAGGTGQHGAINLRNAADIDAITITADNSGAAGLYLGDGAGNSVIELLDLGRINVRQLVDGENRYLLQLDTNATASITAGAEGCSGIVTVRNEAGADVIVLDGAAGDIVLNDGGGAEVFRLDGSQAALYVGTAGKEGDIRVRDGEGRNVLVLNGANASLFAGAEGNEGDVIVRDAEGRNVIQLDGAEAALRLGASGNEGDIVVRDGEGRQVLHFNGNLATLDVGAAGNEGDVRVFDGDGDLRIHLDGASGDVKLLGADCAEDFRVRDAATIEAGTVLVIDEGGGLRQSQKAYDRRVAGVVSGAGGVRPGIVLDAQGKRTDRRPIALAGKVFCQVDAGYGAIGIGDLLTTSDTPGHAMRAADPSRAFGAVIGKALAPHAAGRGLVPILVALQ